MSVALLTSGPYDFEIQLPAPPIADPQLVVFVHPAGAAGKRPSSSCASVRFSLTWEEVAKLGLVLHEALRFQAAPLAGPPPVGNSGEPA